MDILIHIHSGLRWLLLLFLVTVVLLAFARRGSTQLLTSREKLFILITMILTHIQLLLGFILYFGNKRYEGFSYMDDALSRFLAIEHMFGMILAAVLITLGYRKTKALAEGVKAHNRVFLWFGLALLTILISMPWPFRGEGFEYFGWF